MAIQYCSAILREPVVIWWFESRSFTLNICRLLDDKAMMRHHARERKLFLHVTQQAFKVLSLDLAFRSRASQLYERAVGLLATPVADRDDVAVVISPAGKSVNGLVILRLAADVA
jgi:hypothetical protein